MLLIAILLMLGLSSTLIAKASAASWGAKKSIQHLNVRGVIGIIRKMVKLESLELLLIR